jgi:hydroxymethylpyrimidine/phosphomethylpyrimidine kinase
MVAKGGEALLDPGAVGALRNRLLPRATLLTPNLPEAEALTGGTVADLAGMKAAAEELRGLGPKAVLLKGGHLPAEIIYDVLATEGRIEVFESPRIETPNTHGTGCTLASAVAAGIAQNMLLRDAVMRARMFVQEAIRNAPEIGHGHGPLDHSHTVRRFGVD